MEILLDAILAFLSCVGLWTLGQMIIMHLLMNDGNKGTDLTLKDETERWMIQKFKMK